jgi:para-nitrobenzyl esterase
MNRRDRFGLGILIVSIFFSSAAVAGGPEVVIDSGTLRGESLSSGAAVFRGIPYAVPPLAELRWKPPQLPAKWDGVREATDFAPACPQPDHLSRVYGIQLPATDEDCLYLNLWTNNLGGDEPKPVMVWIHGGGHYIGWSHQTTYDGEQLAQRGVVVVTINYRLGPLGYLAHPALTAESPHSSSGNYGILDQIEALRWVQRNIAAFGGDPNRVTIFGESAGGGSVGILMASPLTDGLFHRAICQSGTGVNYLQHLGRSFGDNEPAERVGEQVAEALGAAGSADVIKTLRGLTADEILAGTRPTLGLDPGDTGFSFSPIVDGWVLPDPVIARFDKGQQRDVPLLIGSNADEGTVFLPGMGMPREVAAYQERVRRIYGPIADRILELYPVEKPEDIRNAANRAFTDAGFVAPARMLARSMATVSNSAYLYHFTRVLPGPAAQLGAFHGSEIAFVFDVFPAERRKEEIDTAVADAMGAYWVRFATSGDPNRDGMPEWPAYDAESDIHMEFGDRIGTGTGLRRVACDFFDGVYRARVAVAAR